ncbi:MAG: inositol-3-phosphate synthase, partial [Candidatus Krumholzibacteria bacterium]|nr:inositol-3-phosphate synthase [Candidatus Krumholzibacteria bacterium]
MPDKLKIAAPRGKLGILTPGMGAVSSTFFAGVEAARKGVADPIGSLTQLGHIRLGKRTEDRNPLIGDFAPLASLQDLVFGGWDPISDNAYEAAKRAGVLSPEHLEAVGDELREIEPMKAVFSHDWVKLLEGVDHVKTGESTMDLAEQLIDDI